MTVNSTAVYLDTSIVAKLYIHEPLSDRVDDFVRSRSACLISSAVELEFRCVLARKLRAHQLSAAQVDAAWNHFVDDIELGTLDVLPVADSNFSIAQTLVGAHARAQAVRALDALHIGIALENELSHFATADFTQSDAARAQGLTVELFALPSVQEPSTPYGR